MKIFRATDISINAIPIIADDPHHASHMLLHSMYEGLRHWPGVTYSLGPWAPPSDMAPDILNKLADEHTGGLAHFADDGWEVFRFNQQRTYP